jgi:hypothetical protein
MADPRTSDVVAMYAIEGNNDRYCFVYQKSEEYYHLLFFFSIFFCLSYYAVWPVNI